MKWGSDEGLIIAELLQSIAKPIVIAANKADISSEEDLNNLSNKGAIITVADYELALKKASEVGLIAYNAGDSDFNILSDNLTGGQEDALQKIKDFLKSRGSTGVQECIEKAVLEKLDLIAI